MLKARADGNIQDACKECSYWDEVGHRVKVRSVLTTMVDKLEEKVSAEEFKPSVGDFLKVLEVDKDLEWVDEGPKEIRIIWEEPGPTLRN